MPRQAAAALTCSAAAQVPAIETADGTHPKVTFSCSTRPCTAAPLLAFANGNHRRTPCCDACLTDAHEHGAEGQQRMACTHIVRFQVTVDDGRVVAMLQVRRAGAGGGSTLRSRHASRLGSACEHAAAKHQALTQVASDTSTQPDPTQWLLLQREIWKIHMHSHMHARTRARTQTHA